MRVAQESSNDGLGREWCAGAPRIERSIEGREAVVIGGKAWCMAGA